MSLLADDMNIAQDSRRICGQQIDGDERFVKKACFGLADNSLIDVSSLKNEQSNSSRSTPTYWKPENINDLAPEVFQLIIGRFLKSNNWRKLVPLRVVCRHWRNNIDSYLASRHGFQYTGRSAKGAPPPGINYYEFAAMLNFYPNMRQLIVKNFTVSDHLVAILRQHCPHIERLSLYGCRNLTWKGMAILAVRFPNLTFLDISHTELNENR